MPKSDYRFTTVAEWLNWLETAHTTSIDLGLERVTQVKNRMALNFAEQTVITIAGTNGKGSCVAVLQQLLNSAEVNHVSFTSPHFLRFNERIQHNGNCINDAELIEVFAAIDQARGDVTLSYFEFSALAAMVFAKHKAVDVLLLEVGLGGRLDAVNCIDADIAVVTSIGIDHETWLGNDREVIGREKCGIFRKQAPAICGDSNPPQSIQQVAKEVGCELIQQGEDFSLIADTNGTFTFKGLGRQGHLIELANLQLPQLPLPSIACALQALALSPVNLNALDLTALAETQLMGRWQAYNAAHIGIHIPCRLDVAHNPDAANLLATRLAALPNPIKIAAIFAVMADKDIPNVVQPVVPHVSKWLLPNLVNIERAAINKDCEAMIKAADPQASVESFASMEDLIEQQRNEINDYDLLLVFGSFFTLADFYNLSD